MMHFVLSEAVYPSEAGYTHRGSGNDSRTNPGYGRVSGIPASPRKALNRMPLFQETRQAAWPRWRLCASRTAKPPFQAGRPFEGDFSNPDADKAVEGWEVEWLGTGVSSFLGEDEEEAIELDEDDYIAPKGPKRVPAEMRCFDTARVYVKGGEGGKGCVAFRREKFVPKGGPSGGNGGDGGHVWAQVDASLNSLTSFRKKLHYRAAGGGAGKGSGMHGAAGADCVMLVPPGTIIRRKGCSDDEPPLAELVEPGERALLVAGGRGGRGNASFKSARNNAPTMAEVGESGEEAWLDLELRLVADVGIIGVPNAGKSTLLSVVSAARPKVADYPFTTLVPNLGVCELDYRTTVFADIPGLLEGAHTGLGLGHEFLRHIQRCRSLVHVIDGSSPDPIGDYAAVQNELLLFNPELSDKPQVIAYNKMDLPDSSDYLDEVLDYMKRQGLDERDVVPVSAATGLGILDLVRRVRQVLDSLGEEDRFVRTTDAVNRTEPPRQDRTPQIDDYQIRRGPSGEWVVEGAAISCFAQMTNWDYYEASLRFQKVLDAAGINKALKERGVKEGDTVVIGPVEMVWSDDQSEAALYRGWLEDRRAQGKPFQGVARWPHSGS
eukprot:jgi/Botrbrau1/18926/Bobra.177_2s0079.2